MRARAVREEVLEGVVNARRDKHEADTASGNRHQHEDGPARHPGR